jgi:hypothetical protein
MVEGEKSEALLRTHWIQVENLRIGPLANGHTVF